MRIVTKINNSKGETVDFKIFSDEYYLYKAKGKSNFFEGVKASINSIIASNLNEQNFKNDLIEDFEKIVKACPSEIPAIITKFTTGNYENLLQNNAGITDFGKVILDAFKYKNFRKTAKAAMFCENLKIKSCLYCNAQFTIAVGKNGKTKKLLFQLDHFYNKNTYPFLSLTMGNLIPCCSTCNISKSKTDFNITDYIHPYVEDFSSKITFYINEEDALEYLLNDRNVNRLNPKIKFSDPRVNKHIEIFNIEHIYNKHTDVIEEIVLKSLYYNETKKEELLNTFEELNLNQSTIDRFILGNYTLDSEINNRPLAKLTKDIGIQLKIIK